MAEWNKIDISEHFVTDVVGGYRVVEDQGYISTRCLVDSDQEQYLLEDMIENSKPPKPNDCHLNDYLLFTPFRYPPLNHGSRFGGVYERSIFYGSKDIKTAFAEVAKNRFRFFNDTKAKIDFVKINFTSFMFAAESNSFLYLTLPPFVDYKDRISDRESYKQSQQLGKVMRQANVEIFTYFSAQDKEAINIGIYTPKTFTKNSYAHKQYVCYCDNDNVEFLMGNALKYKFHRNEIVQNAENF